MKQACQGSPCIKELQLASRNCGQPVKPEGGLEPTVRKKNRNPQAYKCKEMSSAHVVNELRRRFAFS